MKNLMKSLILFLVLIVSCSAHSKDNLSGVLSLLLDENRVEVFDDNFDSQIGWYGRFSYGSGNYENIENDNAIDISASGSENGGGDAKKDIDDPVAVNNISWLLKFDYMGFDEAEGYLRLNYGGINIFVRLDERTIPFRVYNGVTNVTLRIIYEDGIVTAKVNGQNLLSPSSPSRALSAETSTDLTSSIEILLLAGGADDFGSGSVLLSSITAHSTLDD